MSKAQRQLWSYYSTPSWVANLIHEHYSDYKISAIADLGAGQGALTHPFYETDNSLDITSIEIDNSHFAALSVNSRHILQSDLLESPIVDYQKTIAGERCLTVSNPPFGKCGMTDEVSQLMSRIGALGTTVHRISCRKEVIFLARALDSAKSGTHIAFILPRSFLTHMHWKKLRKTISEKHMPNKIILLSSRSFLATEAETAILFMQAYTGESDNTSIFHAIPDGIIFNKNINNDEFVNATWCDNAQPLLSRTLGALPVEFARGKKCSKTLEELNIPYIHTSHLRQFHGTEYQSSLQMKTDISPDIGLARSGDILIARVGTRCFANTVLFKGKPAPISDCVIRIRSKPESREMIFKALTSKKGQEWLKYSASGVCAKVLTYRSLKSFPLTTNATT